MRPDDSTNATQRAPYKTRVAFAESLEGFGEAITNRKAAMNKRQLIEAIRKHNTSVETAFLVQFDESDLTEYLARLNAACKKQQLIAGWVGPRRSMRMAS